jgi:hypothetical protein
MDSEQTADALDDLADSMQKANEHIDGGTFEIKGEGLTDEEIEQLRKQAQTHIHGPFTFLINDNHNALRGCQTCGTTWVGFMAGSEDNLRWHYVEEVPEEEEEN